MVPINDERCKEKICGTWERVYGELGCGGGTFRLDSWRRVFLDLCRNVENLPVENIFFLGDLLVPLFYTLFKKFFFIFFEKFYISTLFAINLLYISYLGRFIFYTTSTFYYTLREISTLLYGGIWDNTPISAKKITKQNAKKINPGGCCFLKFDPKFLEILADHV